MGVRDPHGEPTGTPDPVEKSFATLNTIRYVDDHEIIFIILPGPGLLGRMC